MKRGSDDIEGDAAPRGRRKVKSWRGMPGSRGGNGEIRTIEARILTRSMATRTRSLPPWSRMVGSSTSETSSGRLPVRMGPRIPGTRARKWRRCLLQAKGGQGEVGSGRRWVRSWGRAARTWTRQQRSAARIRGTCGRDERWSGRKKRHEPVFQIWRAGRPRYCQSSGRSASSAKSVR